MTVKIIELAILAVCMWLIGYLMGKIEEATKDDR